MSALMTNFDIARDTLEKANSSAGSAEAELSKYQEGLEFSVEKFQASFEQLSSTVLDSDLLKFFIDLGSTGVQAIDGLTKAISPLGTACCECFFKYLKKEETNRRTYHTLQELQLSVFQYIEGFYNSKRPHGSLGMLTPNEKENLYWERA